MKKIKIILCLIILITFFSLIKTTTSADIINEEHIEIISTLTYNKIYNDIIPLNNNSFIGIKDKNSYYVTINKEILLETNYIYDAVINDNILYYSSYNKLVKLDINTYNRIEKSIFNNAKIKLYNNLIYCYGNNNSDAVIEIYDLSLNLINEYMISGDGYETFIDIAFDEYIYLVIYKEALSNNNILKNVGNRGEYVSHILKLDYDLVLCDVLYLYHNFYDELITDIYLKNNKLYFISEEKNSYLYEASTDFSNLKKKEINYNFNMLSSLKDDEYLFYTNYPIFKLYKNDEVIFELEYNIKNYLIENGRLYLYVSNKLNTLIYEIDEYEIEYLYDKYITKNISSLDDLSNIKVSSFFEILKVEISSYEPYLEKLVSGKYIINYVINRKLSNINLSGNLIIEPYTNFLDGLVYPVGKTLEFFGTATMDGKPIYYGYKVNDVGEHEIIVTDVNGNNTTYHILVVNDYYHMMKDGTRCYDDICYLDEIYKYQINLDQVLDIKYLIINGEKWDNYKYHDGLLDIYFSSNIVGIKDYYLEKIVYGDEEKNININQIFRLNYLKNPLDIKIYKELSKKDIHVKYAINDEHNSFIYLKLICNNQEYLIYNDFVIPEGVINVKLKLVYYDGDQFFEDNILEYETTSKISGNINFNYNADNLNLIDVGLSTPKKITNITKLDIVDNNLKSYYDVNDNHLLIIITISISIIMVILMVLFVIIKKHHKRI